MVNVMILATFANGVVIPMQVDVDTRLQSQGRMAAWSYPTCEQLALDVWKKQAVAPANTFQLRGVRYHFSFECSEST